MEPGALHKAGQPGQDRSTIWVCAGRRGTSISGGKGTEREYESLATYTQPPLKLFQQKHERTALPELGWQNNEKFKAKHTHTQTNFRGRLCYFHISRSRQTNTPDPKSPPPAGIPRPSWYPRSGLGPGSGWTAPPGAGANPALPHPTPRRRGP